jgi:hypothetical protein
MPMLLGMRAANAETLWPTVSFKKESKAFQGLGNPKAGAQPAVEAAQGDQVTARYQLVCPGRLLTLPQFLGSGRSRMLLRHSPSWPTGRLHRQVSTSTRPPMIVNHLASAKRAMLRSYCAGPCLCQPRFLFRAAPAQSAEKRVRRDQRIRVIETPLKLRHIAV